MRGDAFIHFVSGSRRVNIRLGVLLLIPKSPQRYETARIKGTFKTRRQTKQIYIHNKTCNDIFRILRWFYIVRKIVLCVCVCVCVCVSNTTKTTERVK